MKAPDQPEVQVKTDSVNVWFKTDGRSGIVVPVSLPVTTKMIEYDNGMAFKSAGENNILLFVPHSRLLLVARSGIVPDDTQVV